MPTTKFVPLMLQYTGDNWQEVCAALSAEDHSQSRFTHLVRLHGDGLVPMWCVLHRGDWIYSFEPGELDLGAEKMGAWLAQLYALAVADAVEAANG